MGEGAFGRFRGRALAGVIAVETKNGFARHFPKKLNLILGKGGPQGGDRVFETCLSQHNYVHVALSDEHRFRSARRRPS